MNPYAKRTYKSFGAFLKDLGYVLGRPRQMWRMHRGKSIDPQFRERLMLAITQVNECAFCTYAHTGFALREGLEKPEIKAILDGDFHSAPESEQIGMVYAQHWAETDGTPDEASYAKVKASYGEPTLAAMHLVFRVIRLGNYCGNFAERLLHRVSFGRLGRVERT